MKNKKLKISLIIGVVLIIILLILFLVFKNNKSYTIVFDTAGGNKISDIKVKNNEIVKMPSNPTKKGYKFIGWVDKKNKLVTSGIKFDKDLTIQALWVKEEAKTNIVTFDTNGGNKIGNVTMENEKDIILPMDPIKEGYIFAGWVNKDNRIVQIGIKITEDITLKALWIKNDKKINTITFDTDGGNKVYNIIIEDGNTIIFPINPIKQGFVFKGWFKEKGEIIKEDMKITSNITLKAIWKEPYTCPSECTPIEDGSKCTKTITTAIIKSDTCPNGYTLKDGRCLDLAHKYQATFIDQEPWRVCNGNDYQFNVIYDLGAEALCAKHASKVKTDTCPTGYTKDNNICKKTDTIKCTAN